MVSAVVTDVFHVLVASPKPPGFLAQPGPHDDMCLTFLHSPGLPAPHHPTKGWETLFSYSTTLCHSQALSPSSSCPNLDGSPLYPHQAESQK